MERQLAFRRHVNQWKRRDAIDTTNPVDVGRKTRNPLDFTQSVAIERPLSLDCDDEHLVSAEAPETLLIKEPSRIVPIQNALGGRVEV